MMLLVGGMLLAHSFFPSVVFGEEGVGFGWCVVYLGQTEAVGKAECLLIDRSEEHTSELQSQR